MSTLPNIDFVANQLQTSGDAKIVLLSGALTKTAVDAVAILLEAAKSIGLDDTQVLLTVVHNEARLQVLPNSRRGN